MPKKLHTAERQTDEPYNQPTRLILPLRAALTASITTAALPLASPAAAASATTVEVATACERGASALSQPGSGARHKNDFLHLQEPGTTSLRLCGARHWATQATLAVPSPCASAKRALAKKCPRKRRPQKAPPEEEPKKEEAGSAANRLTEPGAACTCSDRAKLSRKRGGHFC